MRVVNSIRLREDEAKKSEDAMLKKRCHAEKDGCEGERLSRCRKKAHSYERDCYERKKREEDKAAKELEKTLKPKRPYRRRLQNPSVPVFLTSQMKETAPESERSIL